MASKAELTEKIAISEKRVAELLEKNSSLERRLEELSQVEPRVGLEPEDGELLNEILQVRIAKWVSIARGVKLLPHLIVSAQVLADKVTYQVKDGDTSVLNPNSYGILTIGDNFSGELCDPPPHEHEFRQANAASKPTCSCGKTNKTVT